jgi:hypothetical protein
MNFPPNYNILDKVYCTERQAFMIAKYLLTEFRDVTCTEENEAEMEENCDLIDIGKELNMYVTDNNDKKLISGLYKKALKKHEKISLKDCMEFIIAFWDERLVTRYYNQ